MAQPRAADDFAAIRARMEELKRERERAERHERTNARPKLAEELRAPRATPRRRW
jgi:hypothetical protein